MLEQMLMISHPPPVIDFSNSGPGAKTLLTGDAVYGFFGEITPDKFISGTDFMTWLGLTAGSVRPNAGTTPWLKMVYNGKFLFMPRDSLRYGLSWNSVYQVGAVYGTDDNGLYPTGTPVNQHRVLQIVEDGKTWNLVPRLIRSTSTDPATNDGSSVVITEISEWNMLMSRLVDGRLASYTMEQLGQPITTSRLMTMTTGVDPTRCHLRGVGPGANWGGVTTYPKATAGGTTYWKPVLELVPD